MAAKTDLTWQELQDELPANSITVSGGKVVIDVGVLTGDTVDALTDTGVLEFLYKIREAAGLAQETVNETQVDGEKLDSFPGFTFSPVIDGYVEVSQTSSFKLPVNTAVIVGPNI
ncbi:hypothetical protein BST81_13745 [Leptolyngbya sp. 'hensonii']|uniref:hypothetical protein n=1 Tax=Leptolyngbya sp. 'hensonii' TaxID=1922337 RepID=UPI00094F963E|nr:hypothetical protein [Leptolyngbya sp. 'hensonii']OLP18083.1 hypothetical protein BST81_13745 [Leptolyngbya sp. 'hensonii']